MDAILAGRLYLAAHGVAETPESLAGAMIQAEFAHLVITFLTKS